MFKFHLPYHESDHVLNIAYNALCDARCLQDLELRRQDEAYLNALGAPRIPDPTTAGDFCRRFQPEHLDALQEAIDVARRKVWAGQPASFFEQAILDGDGTMVETDGECKQGMDISYFDCIRLSALMNAFWCQSFTLFPVIESCGFRAL